MSLTFHKKPIKYSAESLQKLIAKYQPYTEGLSPTGEDSKKYEEFCTAINLISGGIRIIISSRDRLQQLVDKLENTFEESKKNRKELISEVEEIENDSQFSEAIARANDSIFVLEALVNEYRNEAGKLASALNIHPQKLGHTIKINGKQPEQSSSQDSQEFDPELAQWLSDDATEGQYDRESITCRTLKPKQMDLPRFYGDDEEFPEFWAVFETLVHENKVLSTVEKMLLLKDALRGRAEMAIKGIQLIPQNYKWMTEELRLISEMPKRTISKNNISG